MARRLAAAAGSTLEISGIGGNRHALVHFVFHPGRPRVGFCRPHHAHIQRVDPAGLRGRTRGRPRGDSVCVRVGQEEEISCELGGAVTSYELNDDVIRPATKYAKAVMPDLIRHPAPPWIPASAGMTKPDRFNCRSNKSYPSDRINRIDGIFSGFPAERLETAGWFAAIRRKEDRVYLTLKTLHLTLFETRTP